MSLSTSPAINVGNHRCSRRCVRRCPANATPLAGRSVRRDSANDGPPLEWTTSSSPQGRVPAFSVAHRDALQQMKAYVAHMLSRNR
jgi:hypothetical protein